MGRIAGVPNKVTAKIKQQLQELIDGIIVGIDIELLNNNQKIKLLQIALQYSIPRLKLTNEQYVDEPSDIQINIVKTSDELERLNKVREYEKENNVRIF
ncbi:MAG: hypothetical protein P8H38_08220 [Flavobacteriaceae bacterium]|nr:hypothetical protein [Flavobacteriaceae bacterium]